MKLYTFPNAPNARKVHAVIYHLDIKGIEQELVNIAAGEQRKPEFLAINPMARIPALVDGDLTLWESNAICEYLCDLQGDTTLFPRDLRVRADISRWLFWQASDWASALGPMIYENFVKKIFFGAEPDPVVVKMGEDRFNVVGRVLDRHLAGRRFMVGDAVTLADFALGSLLTYAEQSRVPMGEYRNIKAWFAGLDEIPAWKKSAPQQPPG